MAGSLGKPLTENAQLFPAVTYRGTLKLPNGQPPGPRGKPPSGG